LSRHLHIVCLDNPFPPDYGGAIDMYQKIMALKAAGISIHLHYYAYGDRKETGDLDKLCTSIQAYPRKTNSRGLSWGSPYTVSSRSAMELANVLQEDNHPVLIEGVHCTGVLTHLPRTNRKVLVRLHNDEQSYYAGLAKFTNQVFKKLFFLRESRLLGKYQASLPGDCLYACISETDRTIFQNKYGLKNVEFLPAFVSWQEVVGKDGVGNFCLYHGNLAIPENEKAAHWLLEKVFRHIKVPLVIAGRTPSSSLDKMAHLCQHTCLVSNPSEKEMNDLVQKAHINIIPSMNGTGVKLKLLHSLFEGRHCIVNKAAVEGSGLEEACHIAANEHAFASIIMQLYHQPFAEEEIRLRKRLLGSRYDNQKNAAKIIAWLY
jgi:hypothetical protein